MEGDRPGRATITHAGGAAPLSVQRLQVNALEGPAAGRTWTVEETRATLGSHPRCDLVIDDPTVSRFHCEIRIDERRARVRDLDSRNGTLVDGVEVVDAWLRDGSRLRLGRTLLRIDHGEGAVDLQLSPRSAFGGLAGGSPLMRRLFERLERAAASDATVLLEGETGTGKTLAARAIHEHSARRGGPFVVLDCGAVPATLLESELFGHERGAFTGASARRTGVFEEASGGTLFLDEIGELPLELQTKLLGALENRSVRPVGGGAPVAVDVRVVAATNRDLRAEVNGGRFRPDVYYRLAVITVVLPALRERPGDVPAVAEQLLRSLGAEQGRIDALLTEELVTRMQQAAWPGNVRELRNYLERCLAFDEVAPLAEGGEAAGAG
ncbi:MAG TPA: sigma 54-interacting transcriptional regulator [Kofleriaceae bacterium]|nr:sigma 54-interacting transcriptional regulator [Kofleriaceae bacterium]